VDAYTIPEAARVAGITPKDVRVRIEEGRLQAITVGGQRAIEKVELERAGLLGDKPEPPTEVQPAPQVSSSIVERLEAQAAELAVLRRASAERRTTDERHRRRLEQELADARSELQAARLRIAELEAAGFDKSLERRKSRPALSPLFRRTPEEPSAD
jgi:cell division septum initiation protein DivIVA